MILAASQLKDFLYQCLFSVKKLGEIKCIVNSSDIDIICITETHFSTEYLHAELAIPNYRIFRNDRDAVVAVHVFIYT